MKKISLQKIIEKIIKENPSKNNSDEKKEAITEYENAMIEYEKKLNLYRNAKKRNRKTMSVRPEKPKDPMIDINKKRIEGMRDKFKKILESFDVDVDLFKIGKKYIFPKKSLPYVKQILLFDLNKTPVYNLKKGQEYHFNEQQLEQIAKLRKVINKLIGYQQKSYEGLDTAMQVTRKLKINDKKAERYIDELLNEKHQVAKKISQLFNENLYPSLTIKQRADIFSQLYLDIETFIESLDDRIHEAIEQTKEVNYKIK